VVTHCYNSSTAKTASKTASQKRKDKKIQLRNMASIFEKTPFFKARRLWDEKTKLPETYKLRSNEYGQKQSAEVHMDGGQFGPEFTVSRTIPDFARGAAKVNLGYEQSLAELTNIFQGPLLTDWNHVVATNYPEPVEFENVRPEHDRSSADNFNRAIEDFLKRHLKEKKPRDRQYIYMAPGGDYGVFKDLLTSPMDHLHRFQEMLRIAELLPAGDIPPPNPALQVEWFYMTFHKSDRSEYVRSGRILADETIVTLAEYFERLFTARLLDGSLQQKRDDKIRRVAKSELRHELEERYKRKLRDVERHRATHLHHRTWNRERDGGNYRDRDHRGSYAKQASTKDPRVGDRKTKPEGSIKSFCPIHGPDSKHTYDECRQNPKNRSASNSNNKTYVKKRAHDAHYQDERQDSSEDASRAESGGRAFSDGELSENGSHEDPAENYHLENFHIPRKVSRLDGVGHKSPKKKKEMAPCGAVAKRNENEDKKKRFPSCSTALVDEPLLSFEEFFPDDISMNSYERVLSREENGLSNADAFQFEN